MSASLVTRKWPCRGNVWATASKAQWSAGDRQQWLRTALRKLGHREVGRGLPRTSSPKPLRPRWLSHPCEPPSSTPSLWLQCHPASFSALEIPPFPKVLCSAVLSPRAVCCCWADLRPSVAPTCPPCPSPSLPQASELSQSTGTHDAPVVAPRLDVKLRQDTRPPPPASSQTPHSSRLWADAAVCSSTQHQLSIWEPLAETPLPDLAPVH